jgi:predicted dehydrogenase
MSSRLTRRRFLQHTLAAAATVTIAGTKSSGKVIGANDTVRVAIAGLNGRGGAHVGGYLGLQGVEIAYLVDPDTRTHGKHLKAIADKKQPEPKLIQDIRKALDDKNVDVVSIATPNHWHALMTIWACQADKDVYVEKPCSHNVHEGRIAVEMARKKNRIVQHGTQSRGSDSWESLAQIVKSGKYGKLKVSRGLCYKPRGSIGMKANTETPKELDFNVWLGPAETRPFNGNLVHYNWHWFWDFGNGDIGNQGVHEMDKARWMIPGATVPKSVFSLGGRFGYTDQGETPNTQMVVFDFGETQLIFEVRGLKTEKFHGEGIGNTLHFEEGTVAGNKFYPKNGGPAQPLVKVPVERKRGVGGVAFGNFIAAVRARKVELLDADILEGHYSSALCHYGNVSYRLGKDETFDPRTRALGDDKQALETLDRMAQHLGKDNGLTVSDLKLRVGRKLTIDPKTERFVGDEEANKLLTRAYRKEFAVPESVA